MLVIQVYKMLVIDNRREGSRILSMFKLLFSGTATGFCSLLLFSF